MLKHNQFLTQIKEYDEAERTITMCGSTETADRVGDVVKMAGVDLENYKKNPIILFNHDYDKPIGKALDVQVIDSKLIFKIQFADTDFGREIYYLLKNGYMNASSIGFIGKEYEPNDFGGLTFTKIELLELSIVSVPCNPSAIVQLRKDFMEHKVSKDLYEALGGNMESNEKTGAKFSKSNIDTIKEAIKLLSGIIDAVDVEEDKPEEEEETKEKSADTVIETDETDKDTKEDAEEETEEKQKAYSNEDLIKEILKTLGGK